jgi:hypothetical protein
VVLGRVVPVDRRRIKTGSLTPTEKVVTKEDELSVEYLRWLTTSRSENQKASQALYEIIEKHLNFVRDDHELANWRMRNPSPAKCHPDAPRAC